MWAAGDYPDVARTIESAAEALAEAVGADAGAELLDVATGSGNVAIAAARARRPGHRPRPHARAAGGCPSARR